MKLHGSWYRQHRVSNRLRNRTWPFPLAGIVLGIATLRLLEMTTAQAFLDVDARRIAGESATQGIGATPPSRL